MRWALDRLRVLQDETFCLSNQTLAAYRIVYFFVALVISTPSSLTWARDYPNWLRDPPPGLPALIGVPSAPVLVVIQWCAIAFAAMGLVGYRMRIAAIGYPILMFIHHSIEFGFGKIDHDVLWLVVPLVLASSGWDDTYALDATRGRGASRHDWALRNGRAVSLLYTFVAVGFFTAGFAKLAHWTDPTFSMAADMVRYYRVVQTDEPVLAEAALQLPSILWEALDYGTIVVELAPLILLFAPRLVQRVVLPLILFHLGVLLTMGIDFGLFVVLYIPLAAHPLAGERFDRLSSRWSSSAWVTIAGASCVVWKIAVAPTIQSLGGQGSFAYVPSLLMFSLATAILFVFSLSPKTSATSPSGEKDRENPKPFRPLVRLRATGDID